MAITTAIVLAGGFGTRLQSVVSDVPKPMAPVAGKPFLDYLLRYLKSYDIKEVVLSVGHLAERVSEYFGEEFEGMSIAYAHELEPLGTGGAIRFAFSKTKAEEAIVLNGDTFFDIDLQQVFTRHQQHSAPGLMVLRAMPKPDRFGTVITDSDGYVSSFREKQEGLESGMINAGVYVLHRQMLNRSELSEKFSIEQDYFQRFVREGILAGLEAEGYFIDIGIPEEYDRAQRDFLEK